MTFLRVPFVFFMVQACRKPEAPNSPSGKPVRVTAVICPRGIAVDPGSLCTYIRHRGNVMKDIHEVLRRKQAKFAQLTKQIEALQQAAEKLREVAPLLAESDEEESTVLAEVEDGNSMAARAGSSPAGGSSAPKPAPRAPRWP
jgi:hypothetical protein